MTPTTSPDPLASSLRAAASNIRHNLPLRTLMDAAALDDTADRIEVDSELLRLADEMLEAVKSEHRGWHDGGLFDAEGPYAACVVGMCARARAYRDARTAFASLGGAPSEPNRSTRKEGER